MGGINMIGEFNPGIKPGDVLNNEQLRNCFKCSPQGGMRRSHKTNTLVVVSNHTRGVYSDRWIGNTLHYTGMGLTGDQELSYSQNKTLAESNWNRVAVHLFEVFEERKYIYKGRVTLAEKPYTANQMDQDGKLRRVWIFPLQVIERT